MAAMAATGTDVTVELRAALDRLVALEPHVLADEESLVGLQREAERLAAVAARALAAFDAKRGFEDDGSATASGWLAHRCKLPPGTARHRLRVGRALRHMPLTEAAWLAGRIGEAQVTLLVPCQALNPEAFVLDEAEMVSEAARVRYGSFDRMLRYWRYYAGPEAAEADAESVRAKRRFHLSQSFEDMFFADGAFDPIGGSILAGALKGIEEELLAADWVEARARLGEEATREDLGRSPAQRRADALVEMARRSGAVPEGARLPEPLFTVLVGYETFAGPICQLANNTVVTPGSLVPYLDDAWIERVVFETADRVMNVGVRRRLFTGATRRAVLVRDQECFHPTCEVPADDCQVDHIEPYAEGGLTTEANGRAACGFHNRLRHRRPQPPVN